MLSETIKRTGNCNEYDSRLAGNKRLEEAIESAEKNRVAETFFNVFAVMQERCEEDGCLIMPATRKNASPFDNLSIDDIKIGDVITLEQDLRLKPSTVQDSEGKKWLALFTSKAEYHKGQETDTILIRHIGDALRDAFLMGDVDGAVINPWGTYFIITNEMLDHFLVKETVMEWGFSDDQEG